METLVFNLTLTGLITSVDSAYFIIVKPSKLTQEFHLVKFPASLPEAEVSVASVKHVYFISSLSFAYVFKNAKEPARNKIGFFKMEL